MEKVHLREERQRLDYCYDKVTYLLSELDNIEKNSVKCRIYPPFGPNGVVKAKLEKEIPIGFKSELGMITNELRSILDGIACRLAESNNCEDLSKVFFPVAKSEEHFLLRPIQQKIKHFSEHHQRQIQTVRPWMSNDPKYGPPVLYYLHKADNIRKHRNLLKFLVKSDSIAIGPGDNYIGRFKHLNSTLTTLNEEVDLIEYTNMTGQFKPIFQLSYFDSSPLDGVLIRDFILSSYKAIDQLIIFFRDPEFN